MVLWYCWIFVLSKGSEESLVGLEAQIHQLGGKLTSALNSKPEKVDRFWTKQFRCENSWENFQKIFLLKSSNFSSVAFEAPEHSCKVLYVDEEVPASSPEQETSQMLTILNMAEEVDVVLSSSEQIVPFMEVGGQRFNIVYFDKTEYWEAPLENLIKGKEYLLSILFPSYERVLEDLKILEALTYVLFIKDTTKLVSANCRQL